MKITRNNYEAFFLDYIEGKLAADMQQEFRAFLEANPDLASELEEVRRMTSSDIPSDASEVIFPNKKSLHKDPLPIDAEKLNELLAREVDGLLSKEEALSLDQLSSSYPFISAQRKAFALTKLHPSPEVFQDKETIRIPALVSSGTMDKLIAAAEGDLDDNSLSRLMELVSSDQPLQRELALLKQTKLRPVATTYDHKQSLYVNVAPDMMSVNDLLAAKAEGDLTLTQHNKLSGMLANNPALQADLALLYRVKIKPGNETYPFKNNLKRSEKRIIPIRSIGLSFTSIAAVFVIALLVINRDPGTRAKNAFALSGPAFSLTPFQDAGGSSAVDAIPSSTEFKKSQASSASTPDQYNTADRNSVSTTVKTNDYKKITPSKVLLLDVADNRNIIMAVPDMEMILQDPAKKNAVINYGESESAWSYLTKMAAEKIENTYAYSLAERQYEKVIGRQNQDITIKKEAGDKEDELHIKIGSFEFRKDISNRSGEGHGLTGRLERIYRKLARP